MKNLALFISILVLCFSCSPNIHVTKEEAKWLDKFFTDVFLEQGAVFTLWGTKPITVIPVYLFTDEEMQILYNELSEEQKKQVVILEDYDLPKNWEKWKVFQKNLDIKQFAFFLRDNLENPKIPEIWFVNILQTILAIEEHHELFTEILGMNFDSRQVTAEIRDPNSIFWEKVMKEPVLLGILYGFGKYNALSFHQKHVHNDSALDFTFSDTCKLGHTSLSNFPLPIFASFSKKDLVIEKYAKERTMIKKMYGNKNFIHATLRKLQE